MKHHHCITCGIAALTIAGLTSCQVFDAKPAADAGFATSTASTPTRAEFLQQVWVAKEYRGIGLVGRLYGHFRESLQTHYRYTVTDIAKPNQRSLQAHLKTGFQVIHSINFEGLEWNVVLWDWTSRG